MGTESFTVIALPHSWQEGRQDTDFNVSLFVAPRLTPAGGREPLSGFPLWVEWGPRLRDLTLLLRDQDGVLDCEPVKGRFDPDLWARMFPADLEVRSNVVPDWADRDWRSFDARSIQDFVKEAHLGTVQSSLTEPPRPSDSPVLRAHAESLIPRYAGSLDSPRKLNSIPPRFSYDERDATARLDDTVMHQSLQDWADRFDRGQVADPLGQLHRLRRFYERLESKQDYRDKPDPDHVSDPLPNREPEFHERVAAVGDHGELLRALGLVVDLRVRDLDRLRRATRLWGYLGEAEDDERCRSFWVAVAATGDGALVCAPDTDDWSDGALTLGSEKFTVLDIDVDGSGLKADRFVYTLPRLLRTQLNRGQADAASPAMRGSGLTVARRGQGLTSEGRLDRQQDLQASTDHLLHLEDVTRGMRVEVWDDDAKRWHSLHERRTHLTVDGTPVLTDERTTGFIQGTTASETVDVPNSPIYIHEAMFGWEGWSLSVPRPGLRVRHAGDSDPDLEKAHHREIVEKPTQLAHERPPHPFQADHRVEPRSLPRLRYGRSYAFRAWAVDLAGNSRPLGGRVVLDLGSQLRKVSKELLAERVTDTGSALRAAVGEIVAGRALRRSEVTGIEKAVTRRSLIEEAVHAVVSDPQQVLVADTAVHTVEGLADVVGAAAGDLDLGSKASLVVKALRTITRLKPFLRWDPVLAPVVVPRRRFTEGESTRVLVIRSGVTQDPVSLELTVTDPSTYAAEVAAAHPGLDLRYHADSSRHLAPPKTTQMQAELHGKFDTAIGSTNASTQQKMLNWALAEEGSFLDKERTDLDTPGVMVPQPGIALEHQPDSLTVPVDLDSVGVGDMLPPGQYVVHDTPDVTLPYLPDPMVAGISVVFPEAGGNLGLPELYAQEGFTTPYSGTWPAVEPVRLDLVGAELLGAERKGRVLELRLPAGDVQKLRLSSSLRKEELDLLAVWRHMNQALTSNPDIVEAAADGWIWGLTPAEDLMLVHAVPRPLQVPRPMKLVPDRREGDTSAVVFGNLDVHGPSTASVTAEGAWVDPVDELSQDGPGERAGRAVAFQVPVRETADMVFLSDKQMTGDADEEYLDAEAAVHEFGDTKHRRVTYRFRATTRFREYFHPDVIEPVAAIEGDDGLSVVSHPVEVSIPSSAHPAPPVVHSVIPLFRWESETENEQPMAWRHVRQTGVRIYLERPWFSSGEGELLGVVLARGADDDFLQDEDEQSGFPFVSKIGADPIWDTRSVDNRAMVDLQLASFLVREDWDDRPRPGRPVAWDENVSLPVGDGVNVVVAGYRPQYNEERKLWYVDVAIDPYAQLGDDPKHAFWPFVRLAVCRYQPSSIDGVHLSAPVRCDYVQLPPVRTTSVSRTDHHSVRVVVSGTIGRVTPIRRGLPDPHRLVVAKLQRRDPQVPTDLGWRTVEQQVLPQRAEVDQWDVAWVGELHGPKDFDLRRPAPNAGAVSGLANRWRVTVEEWERFAGDPEIAQSDGPPLWEQRLVYADEILL